MQLLCSLALLIVGANALVGPDFTGRPHGIRAAEPNGIPVIQERCIWRKVGNETICGGADCLLLRSGVHGSVLPTALLNSALLTWFTSSALSR
jgi:hypothetical protein